MVWCVVCLWVLRLGLICCLLRLSSLLLGELALESLTCVDVSGDFIFSNLWCSGSISSGGRSLGLLSSWWWLVLSIWWRIFLFLLFESQFVHCLLMATLWHQFRSWPSVCGFWPFCIPLSGCVSDWWYFRCPGELGKSVFYLSIYACNRCCLKCCCVCWKLVVGMCIRCAYLVCAFLP